MEGASFWKKLSDKMSKSKDPVKDIEQAMKDLRAYERYKVWDLEAVKLIYGGSTYNVRDMSFSGLGADWINASELEQVPFNTITDAKMHVLGQEFPVHVICVRKMGSIGGLRFQHDLPESLVKLGTFIEHLRGGATFQEIDKSNVKEKYQHPDWIALRGDGPVDLLISKGTGGSTRDAVLSFPRGEQYQELTWNHGVIKTGVTMDNSGPGSRVAQTQEVDETTLRQGIEILLGVKQADWRVLIEPLLIQALSLLKKKAT